MILRNITTSQLIGPMSFYISENYLGPCADEQYFCMDQNALDIPFLPLPIFLPYMTSPLSPVQLAGEPDYENTSSGLWHVGLTGELGG